MSTPFVVVGIWYENSAKGVASLSSSKDKWVQTGKVIAALLALLFSERQINCNYGSQAEFLPRWREVIANLLALLFIRGQFN